MDGSTYHLDLPEVTENRRRASLFRMCTAHSQTAIVELREALETLNALRTPPPPPPPLSPTDENENQNQNQNQIVHTNTLSMDDLETHIKQALEVLLHSGHPSASPTLSALSSSFHKRLQAVSNVSEEVSQWLSATYSPHGRAVPSNIHLTSNFLGAPSNSMARQITDPWNDDIVGNDEVQRILQNALDWDKFDVFALHEATGGRPLSSLALHLFHVFGLVDTLRLSITKLRNYWIHIEQGYHTVRYHNSTHAADVMHDLAFLLRSPSLAPLFDPLHICAALVAAGIHDHQHPGVNNSFLINTSHELALRYNDRSVLEHHHASSGLIALQTLEHNNFLSHLDKNQFQNFRQLVISMVLATDMSSHFQLQADFTTTFGDYSVGRVLDSSKRELLLQQLLHCADLANTGKPFRFAEIWGDRVSFEFFAQGDKEKSCGLQVSPGNNRHTSKVEHSQLAFIQHIVKPMFEKMLHVVPEIQILIDHATNNIACWNERHKRLFGTPATTTTTTTTSSNLSNVDALEQPPPPPEGNASDDSSDELSTQESSGK